MTASQPVLWPELPAADRAPEAEPCCWMFPWREESDKWRRLWWAADQQRLVLLWLVVRLLVPEAA